MKMKDMVLISVDDHISEPPDMFENHLRGDDLATAPRFVVALRARAAADGVDTTPISTGGATPLAAGEVKRRITSGDVMKMFEKQAKLAS